MTTNILNENGINIFNVGLKDYMENITPNILMNTKKYFENQGEKVIYFEYIKTLNYSKKEIEAILLAYTLEKNVDLLEKINYAFDFGPHLWEYENYEKGTMIYSGAMRILNYILTCYMAPEGSIIIIDNYKQGLHPHVQKKLLNLIGQLSKPKYLIATTHEIDDLHNLKDIKELESYINIVKI